MTDPRIIARALILERLKADVELFVALQYLGLVDQAELHALFAGELAPARDTTVDDIIARGMAPSPAHETPERPRWNRADAMRQARGEHRERIRGAGRGPLPSQVVAFHGSAPPRRSRSSGKGRSLFAQWMENEIEWSPAVMGWEDDDPRAEGME